MLDLINRRVGKSAYRSVSALIFLHDIADKNMCIINFTSSQVIITILCKYYDVDINVLVVINFVSCCLQNLNKV